MMGKLWLWRLKYLADIFLKVNEMKLRLKPLAVFVVNTKISTKIRIKKMYIYHCKPKSFPVVRDFF